MCYERTDSVAVTSIRGRNKDGSRRSISSLETYMKRWLKTPRTPVFPTQNLANACSPQLPYFPLFLLARLCWKAKYWAPCRIFRGIIFLILGWMSIFSCRRHYYSSWFPGKAVRLRDTDSLANCSWLPSRGDCIRSQSVWLWRPGSYPLCSNPDSQGTVLDCLRLLSAYSQSLKAQPLKPCETDLVCQLGMHTSGCVYQEIFRKV